MGTYGRTSDEEGRHYVCNGYPIYSKKMGSVAYLFRVAADFHANPGAWLLTNDRKNIAKNSGIIVTTIAADLPIQDGVGWLYSDHNGSQYDSAMACVEVRVQACRGTSTLTANSQPSNIPTHTHIHSRRERMRGWHG